LSIKYGAEGGYTENRLVGKGNRGAEDKRFEVKYNPQLFAILTEELLVNAGVNILYGIYAVGVTMNENSKLLINLIIKEFKLLLSLLNSMNGKIDKLRLQNVINKFSLPKDKCKININCV